ncbi:hypothetical protein SI859A1_00618 [Aurantimonas manganoxydans SI85-9A1]|uniref:Uncharacterized protein n=1 Tax=Aurantimonas manganoxydans (strain ATCC BAA-1229 / DSM 21871 / SI85-9A1) TaxID=287752 RepID=Q1YKM5_AURMS|nr:hypothetical protein SI859A1_00618 [Aurantimonas manganoxydans SI85-9A1]
MARRQHVPDPDQREGNGEAGEHPWRRDEQQRPADQRRQHGQDEDVALALVAPQRRAPADAAEKGEDRRRIARQREDQLRIGDEGAARIGERRGHRHEGDQPRQTEDPRGLVGDVRCRQRRVGGRRVAVSIDIRHADPTRSGR